MYQFNWFLERRSDQHQTFRDHLLLRDALQDDIGFLRPFNVCQVEKLPVDFDSLRQRGLTHFTIQPIFCCCCCNVLLLPFEDKSIPVLLLHTSTLDPLLQALEVDKLARATAFAGSDEWIVLSLLLKETDLTRLRGIHRHIDMLHELCILTMC